MATLIKPGDPYILRGRVVPMAGDPMSRADVFIRGTTIVDVLRVGATPPAGFEGATRLSTRGTIYPGLIELHNHLSYNALPAWAVPRKFTNRDQWSTGPVYRKLISGPMSVLGRSAGLPEAVVRYVEAKALLGGTTTSQGIALYSAPGIRRYYFGSIRNVEATKDPKLPNALGRIPDIDARDAAAFLDRQHNATCLILHLSEGTDASAHRHFEALHLADGRWAITKSFVGIHAVALKRADFDVLAATGASMVWSPLSNLLLYGATADVAGAKAAGVRIGLGADWSPSGSRNLLFELRVARAVSAVTSVLTDQELLQSVTTSAAAILGWSDSLGSIEKGKRADLLVIGGTQGDPYAHLFDASETDVDLVVIDGVSRVGSHRLMTAFAIDNPESITVAGTERVLNLRQTGVDPLIADLTLAEAARRLEDALAHLADLARALEQHPLAAAQPRLALELDQEEAAGYAIRPHLPGPDGRPTAELRHDLALAAAPLSTVLGPLPLDALTVAGDPAYVDALVTQPNLPPAIRDAIARLR